LRQARCALSARLIAVAAAALVGAAAQCAEVSQDPSAPGSNGAAKDYVDRVMPDAPAQLDIADDGTPAFEPTGMPRSLRLESRVQSSASDQGYERSGWQSLRATLETSNHGALSLDASFRYFDQTQSVRSGPGASFSLYQIGVPFAGGWSASQGLGVIQTLMPRLSGQQAAFFVPTRLVEGASTQWRNDATGLSVQLSGGQTGSYGSIGQGSFYASGDRVAAVGFEIRPARSAGASLLPPSWSYSALASTASGSSDQTVPGFGIRLGEASGTGLLQSVRWESSGLYNQGNLLLSRNQDVSAQVVGQVPGPSSSRLGVWLDGALESGAQAQRWGLHHLAEGLSWQGTPLGSNAQGGYYRWSKMGLRTQIDVQLSSTRPVDAVAGGSTLNQAGISVRQYIDQQLGVGGLLQLNGGTASGWQASGFSELRRSWANLRFQAGLQTADQHVVEQQLSADESWTLPVGQRLSTSEALTTTRAGAQDANGATIGNYGSVLELAVAGGLDLNERVVADLNGRIGLPLSSQTARLYNFSASSQWRFAPGWSLGAVLAVSRSSGLTLPSTASPIPNLPGAFATTVYPGTSSRDFWITLRYDFQAGTASVPIGLGGHQGAGGGDVTGVVYLDDTGSGRLEAIKTRVPNVTVLLDGRYATRTDAQGRFDFPFVAAGPHAIVVLSDTLPLPWTVPDTKALHIEVYPRETTRLEIGATRDPANTAPP